MFDSILNAFRAPDIRRRILFVLGVLIVFRRLAHVPVPGADPTKLAAFFKHNALFGLLDLFSGGGLSRFSVVGLGVNPYINASIIMQLMTGVVPCPARRSSARVSTGATGSTSTPATSRSRWRSSRATASWPSSTRPACSTRTSTSPRSRR